MTKRTELNQIEINLETGEMALRFALYDEDGDRKWHRTSINKDTDIDAQMALVNEHLGAMKKRPVDAAAIDKIKSLATQEFKKD